MQSYPLPKSKPFLITLKYPKLTYIFPSFQMFSRGNIIQKGNQKNIREPYTILPRFSISQRKPFDVPCQNPLWHAFTEIKRESTEPPQNSCTPLLPPSISFISFIWLATDNRTCREDAAIVDWSTAVRNGGGRKMESIYL